ncbi:MAG: efflux RND transporter periplasmic adaptor subunit [Thermoflexales bacterium]|nr:efflux RND transporter periplasmic adaptor subunit [Thermoflexales bacterium]
MEMKMHPNPRRVIPIVLLLLGIGAAAWWYFGGSAAAASNGPLTASGTIEAREIRISPEVGGRVQTVAVAEGEAVEAGATLVTFDATVLTAQRAQAEATLKAAQANAEAAAAARDAALANLALLRAGPSPEQLAVAQTVVDRAQVAVDALQETYDNLTELARETPNGKNIKQQLDAARATLANAQAQYELTRAGARTEQIEAAQAQARAAEAQWRAAQAQVEAAQAALGVLDAQLGRLTLVAPAGGVVLSRAIEPGEFAAPGATLLVLGDLDALTITVYVPEDRYGRIRLGQAAQVTVDSFPGETFTATVAHIADRAEFTPRNVQTAEGRKSTVFAIRLAIENPNGKLKPGMPADVTFAD